MTGSRKQCREGDRCFTVTLKEALDCLGHHSDLSVSALAARTGVHEGTLNKQLSRWDLDNLPPLRQVVPLTRASGNPALLTYFARECDGIFVPLPASIGGADGQNVARMVREFGELLEAVATASADGCTTSAELPQLERQWWDVVQAGAAYIEQMRAAVPQSRGGR